MRFKKYLPQLIITFLIVLMILVFLSPKIFHVVYAGEGAVLYKPLFGGTVTDKVFGEGLHITFPWNTLTKYNVRFQKVDHTLYVLTEKGLRIELTLTIRYQPEYEVLGVLHQRVGPNYLKKIVIPQVESTLRTTIGKFQAEEVYTTQRAILQKIINKSLEQVSQKFIRIDDVIIRKVDLPKKIREAIEFKLEQKELADAYFYKLRKETEEAKRKVIEATGIKKFNDIIDSSLSPQLIKWKGIQATQELATSKNAKTIVIGNGPNGLPIILSADKDNTTGGK